MVQMKNTIAFVDLCFGKDDNTAIGLISIRKISGPTAGVTAHIPKTPVYRHGKLMYIEMIQGAAADELKMLALIAFDKVKQMFGLKFDKSYRVGPSIVVEKLGEDNAERSSGVGQQSTP